MAGQLSLFATRSCLPTPDELEGLLAGPGQAVRRGIAARLSILVPAADGWRVRAMVEGLADLGMAAESITTAAGTVVVRTPFEEGLLDLAARWARGAVKAPPPDLVLDGARLRWWCIAAGGGDWAGFALRLGPGDDACWPALGAALSAAGVPGTLVRSRGATPAYRIVGRRRVARLAELVGEPPPGAPARDWPA